MTVPVPDDGEVTLTEAARLVPVGKERLRQLASANSVSCRKVKTGKYTTYFFKPEALTEAFANRLTPTRRTKPTGSQPTSEVLYLREQIDKAQAQRDALQAELTKVKVGWAAAEARIDELTRTSQRQAVTIGALSDALKEAGHPSLDMGN